MPSEKVYNWIPEGITGEDPSTSLRKVSRRDLNLSDAKWITRLDDCVVKSLALLVHKRDVQVNPKCYKSLLTATSELQERHQYLKRSSLGSVNPEFK